MKTKALDVASRIDRLRHGLEILDVTALNCLLERFDPDRTRNLGDQTLDRLLNLLYTLGIDRDGDGIEGLINTYLPTLSELSMELKQADSTSPQRQRRIDECFAASH